VNLSRKLRPLETKRTTEVSEKDPLERAEEGEERAHRVDGRKNIDVLVLILMMRSSVSFNSNSVVDQRQHRNIAGRRRDGSSWKKRKGRRTKDATMSS